MEPPISSDAVAGLANTLADAQNTAREQLTAAWQLHIDRVREQLETGWQEQIDHIFRERFAEVEGRLQADFDAAVAARAKEISDHTVDMARTSAQREMTELLN